MTASIIVYGPQGCGKTRHAAELQQHFWLRKLYDTDCPPLYAARGLPRHDTLILTHEKPRHAAVRALSFAEAMRQVRTQPTTGEPASH